MKDYSVGSWVVIHGQIRRFVSRVNTCGDWKVNRPVDDRLLWNETEFKASVQGNPVDPARTRKYWGTK